MPQHVLNSITWVRIFKSEGGAELSSFRKPNQGGRESSFRNPCLVPSFRKKPLRRKG
jgi:hypothetical protein